MKRIWAGFFIFAFALSWLTPGAYAAQGHGHDGGGAAGLSLNDGKKWPTDEALRRSMGNIRGSVEPELAAIRAGKATRVKYNALARKINGEVAYIVQNCQLERNADAMLHLVLAELIAGADAMQGKDKHASRRSGAVRVVHALESYGTYFDDPGWKPLKSPD